jgi:hypothetical protein
MSVQHFTAVLLVLAAPAPVRASDAARPFFPISVSTVSTGIVQQQALPGLTIMMGETWIFHIENGQPAGARRAGADEKPGEGEIRVTLDRRGGATMTVINNSEEWYNYRAFISAKPGHKGNRTSVCTLGAGGWPMVEHWPEPFPAIRIADFTEAPDGRIRCE